MREYDLGKLDGAGAAANLSQDDGQGRGDRHQCGGCDKRPTEPEDPATRRFVDLRDGLDSRSEPPLQGRAVTPSLGQTSEPRPDSGIETIGLELLAAHRGRARSSRRPRAAALWPGVLPRKRRQARSRFNSPADGLQTMRLLTGGYLPLRRLA